MKLTPEQKRIKIAEACGWVRTPLPSPCKSLGDKWCAWTHPLLKPVDDEPGFDPWHAELELPDYLNDLNAMHEAEKVLTKEQTYTFNSVLIDLKVTRKDVKAYAERWTFHATAAQRAEAFGLTLGLWT